MPSVFLRPKLIFYILLLVLPFKTYAAFPVVPPESSIVEQLSQPINNPGSEKGKSRQHQQGNSGIAGIMSFVVGVAAIASLFIGTTLLLFGILSITALCLGIVGLKNKLKGFAIAGIVLSAAGIALIVGAIIAHSNYK